MPSAAARRARRSSSRQLVTSSDIVTSRLNESARPASVGGTPLRPPTTLSRSALLRPAVEAVRCAWPSVSVMNSAMSTPLPPVALSDTAKVLSSSRTAMSTPTTWLFVVPLDRHGNGLKERVGVGVDAVAALRFTLEGAADQGGPGEIHRVRTGLVALGEAYATVVRDLHPVRANLRDGFLRLVEHVGKFLRFDARPGNPRFPTRTPPPVRRVRCGARRAAC